MTDKEKIGELETDEDFRLRISNRELLVSRFDIRNSDSPLLHGEQLDMLGWWIGLQRKGSKKDFKWLAIQVFEEEVKSR